VIASRKLAQVASQEMLNPQGTKAWDRSGSLCLSMALHRLFGGWCPTYTTGQNLVVQWDPTRDTRSFTSPTETLAPSAHHTLLVITTTGGVELAQIAVAGASGPATIANADLVAALGSQIIFSQRDYSQMNGFRSLGYDEITVSKV
jgi:hypothetical protein